MLFYGHYDVQPVDPLNLWRNPPFEPKLEAGPQGEQIVARGASDDKGQLMTFLEACRAFRQFGGPPCHVTVLFEGEEETGSPSLPAFLAANAKELKADIALVCDTGMWDRSTPGDHRLAARDRRRGSGADRRQSRSAFGHLRRAWPSTRFMSCRASSAPCTTNSGAVALPGFYDGVEEVPQEILRPMERARFRRCRRSLRDVGLTTPAGERDRTPLEQIWARPTCDVNGIVGGYAGEGFKTVLPAKASAKVSFRLVGKQKPGAHHPGLPRFRHLAPASRRQGGIRRPRRQPRHFAAGQEPGLAPRPPCARGRMGEAGGAGRAAAGRSRSSARSSASSTWTASSSASPSKTTGSIRRTRNTSARPFTRAPAPGRASWPLSQRERDRAGLARPVAAFALAVTTRANGAVRHDRPTDAPQVARQVPRRPETFARADGHPQCDAGFVFRRWTAFRAPGRPSRAPGRWSPRARRSSTLAAN